MVLFREKGYEITYNELVFYRLDYWFSTSPGSKVTSLLAATVFLVVTGGTLIVMFFPDVDFFASLWISWTYVIDSGAHAEVDGFTTRIIALMITIGGMCVCMCVCMYMYVCMYLCIYVRMYVYM